MRQITNKPKKISAGFMDINMEPSWEYTRLFGDTKELLIMKRRRVLQELLNLMRKELGEPCRAYAVGCVVCESYLAFMQLDSILVDEKKNKNINF